MKKPAISVVMPVRNARHTLQEAILSIQCQSFKDWELIIVNDDSTDDTPSAVHSFQASDTRIRVLRNPGSGIVSALNAGLEASCGQFIARMDADDVSLPRRLEGQSGFLEQHPEIGLVSCKIEFGGDRYTARGYALHVDWLNEILSPEDILLNRFVESPLAHPSAMFRAPLIDTLGGYRDGPFPEDYELWLRWLDAEVRIAKVPEMLFRWNDPADRLSRNDPRYAPLAFARVKAVYLAQELSRKRAARQLWIWGAGATTRKRAELLTQHGMDIKGYIDIDPRKIGRTLGNRPVIRPSDIPSPSSAVVASFVGNRGARQLIREDLNKKGFVEGRDFWLAA